MLKFEGDKEFAQAPGEVFALLSDTGFLATCIPGAESITTEPHGLRCKLRPGLAFMRGTIDVELRIVEAVPAKALGFHVHSKGIGSSSTVAAGLGLTEQGTGGTRAHWVAEVTQLGGLMRAVPQGLLQGAAQKVIEDLWAGVEQKLKGN